MTDARAAGRTEAVGLPGLAKLFDVVLDAAETQRELRGVERQLFFDAGARSAEARISLGDMIDAYLRGAGELWELLFSESTAGPTDSVALSRSLRRISESAVAALADGFEAAQRQAIRAEETARRELIEALLSPGPIDPSWFQRAADRAGFRPGSHHVVAVASGASPTTEGSPIEALVQRQLTHRFPSRGWTVAAFRGRLVLIVGDADPAELEILERVLVAESSEAWVVGVGTRHAGLEGVGASHAEAEEAITLAVTVGRSGTVHHGDLLVERLLVADREILTELATHVLAPLDDGNDALIRTLTEYFAACGNMAEAARRLHVGSRTVAYRLDRVAAITGRSLHDADDRLVLELAVRSRAVHAAPPA